MAQPLVAIIAAHSCARVPRSPYSSCFSKAIPTAEVGGGGCLASCSCSSVPSRTAMSGCCLMACSTIRRTWCISERHACSSCTAACSLAFCCLSISSVVWGPVVASAYRSFHCFSSFSFSVRRSTNCWRIVVFSFFSCSSQYAASVSSCSLRSSRLVSSRTFLSCWAACTSASCLQNALSSCRSATSRSRLLLRCCVSAWLCFSASNSMSRLRSNRILCSNSCRSSACTPCTCCCIVSDCMASRWRAPSSSCACRL
mmetsp:Transcript_56211/g.100124  ORF Transcript_56211/g.100124 Transcript_56211/m.100124 type:complete len:256 (-) Transcript_56211:2075-2842(-)